MDTITVTVGTGESHKDLEDRSRVVEEKIRKDAQEMVEVLRLDFPKFFDRSVRERYVAADLALSGDALRAVKASVVAAGQKAVETILPQLEVWDLWLDDDITIPPVDERKTLAGNVRVHALIQECGEILKELLVEHGFPLAEGESFDDTYRLPTWFIGGRLLVSLVESHWRSLEELRACRSELKTLSETGRQAQRAEEWDAA
jgi:hypothetical protein